MSLTRHLWRRSLEGDSDAFSWASLIAGVLIVTLFLGMILATERDRRRILGQARASVDAFCAQSPRKAQCEALRDVHHKACAEHFAIDSTSSPRRGAPPPPFKAERHVACAMMGVEQYFKLKRAKTPARVERVSEGGFDVVTWGDGKERLP